MLLLRPQLLVLQHHPRGRYAHPLLVTTGISRQLSIRLIWILLALLLLSDGTLNYCCFFIDQRRRIPLLLSVDIDYFVKELLHMLPRLRRYL